MRLILVLFPFLFLFTISIFSQPSPPEYRMDGVVETSGGARIPGVSFSIEKDGGPFQRNGYSVGAFSDINGVFSLVLPAGNYKITATGISETQFRLFLLIDQNGPKPDRLFIPMEENVVCSAVEHLNLLPMKKLVPVYPPAARAVRAIGTVRVAVEISSDGTVSSAKAVSGHPLLRSSSATAARGFVFETSDQNVRTISLSFIFLDGVEEKKDLKRLECPDRILVPGLPALIN